TRRLGTPCWSRMITRAEAKWLAAHPAVKSRSVTPIKTRADWRELMRSYFIAKRCSLRTLATFITRLPQHVGDLRTSKEHLIDGLGPPRCACSFRSAPNVALTLPSKVHVWAPRASAASFM